MAELSKFEICRRPRILVADSFMPEETLRELEAAVDVQESQSEHLDLLTQDSAGLSFEFIVEHVPAALELNQRVFALLGIGNAFAETLRYRRYFPGESHPAHCDHYEMGGCELVATALLHLEDTDIGGQTNFLDARPAPLAVSPKRGRLVAWFNHGDDGAPDPNSRHEGAPVVKGVKATLTQFLYQPRSVLSPG